MSKSLKGGSSRKKSRFKSKLVSIFGSKSPQPYYNIEELIEQVHTGNPKYKHQKQPITTAECGFYTVMNLLRINLPKDFMDSMSAQVYHDSIQQIDIEFNTAKRNEFENIRMKERVNSETKRIMRTKSYMKARNNMLSKRLNKKYNILKKSAKKESKSIIPGKYRKNYDQSIIMKTLDYFGFNFDNFYFMKDYINIKEGKPISANAAKWLTSDHSKRLSVTTIDSYIDNAFGIIINTTGKAPSFIPGSSGHHWLSIKKFKDGKYFLLDSGAFSKGKQQKSETEFLSYIKTEISKNSNFFIVTKKHNELSYNNNLNSIV
jgi:hypothetical protein